MCEMTDQGVLRGAGLRLCAGRCRKSSVISALRPRRLLPDLNVTGPVPDRHLRNLS